MSNYVRLAVVAFLITLAVATFIWWPQVNRATAAILWWTNSLGAWGPVTFVLIYIVGCVLFIPGSLLTIGAGMVFGLSLGVVVVSIGSTLGSGVAFLLARFVFREWVAEKTKSLPRFRALDEAVGREGFKVVLLARLSPLFPFNALNYTLGVTSVPLRDYMLASWMGMLPGAILYVYLGTAVRDFAELASGQKEVGLAEQVLFAGGLMATTVLVVVVVRLTRRSLASVMSQPSTGSQL